MFDRPRDRIGTEVSASASDQPSMGRRHESNVRMSAGAGRSGSSPAICILQRYLPPDPSGAGKQAITLGRALAQRGHEVFLLGESNNDAGPVDEIGGIPVVWMRSLPADPSRFQLLRYWAHLVHTLFRLRCHYDVLHVHAVSFVHAAAIPAARFLGKPVLVRSSLEGEVPEPHGSRSDWIHYQFLRLASGFAVISRHLEREYLSGGISSNRIWRVPNGVDTDDFRPVSPRQKKELRTRLGLPETATILVYHGVFVARKSIHWAVPRLENYLEERDLVLLLIGSPGRDEEETGYFSRLHERIQGSPACDSILLTGFKQDVHRYLQAADMYLLPSTGEGLPNALLEAMATGLICVVSGTSGSEEVIDDGKSGFLFKPRDDLSFAESFERALEAEGSDRGRKITRRAVRLIRNRYSIDAVADQYSETYSGLF